MHTYNEIEHIVAGITEHLAELRAIGDASIIKAATDRMADALIADVAKAEGVSQAEAVRIINEAVTPLALRRGLLPPLHPKRQPRI